MDSVSRICCRKAVKGDLFTPGKSRGKEHAMAKTSPWHSVKADVYHDDTDCNTGNNIERENLRSGTGGKPKCAECKRLNG